MRYFFNRLSCIFLLIMMSANTISAQGYPGFTYLPQQRHHPLERKRMELAKGVYAFIGYGLSNFGMIATKNGYILIDVGSYPTLSEEALKEIRQLAPDSLQAIILTHSHGDHRGGGDAFLKGNHREVPVYAHYNFGVEQREIKGLEKITAQRSARQFGQNIPDEMYPVNMIVPRFPGLKVGPLITPNPFVNEGKTELTIDGVKLEVYTTPSETSDHLAIWLPDRKVLFSGDAVYGCFPNLYPIRGGAYRDMEQWAKSIHRLAEFNPEAIMFGHTTALLGAANIQPVLNNTAEAIEYVYNETIKGMNEGRTPDDLAVSVQLPLSLSGDPYLAEIYGAIPWAVREIYAAKLGWFDGNPTNLVPLTPQENAERLAQLAGGKEQLVLAAREAIKKKDYRWAANLADCLVQLGRQTEGRHIKAEALEGISNAILPIAGKNYLMDAALDLRK
jgi:alkyl sulfatase BDS1-like metallo-beta-lactamase superfamily hydrolase